jgi:hypothetical protein
MFDHFRQVMDTCTSLSRGQAFLQIAELFRNNLRFCILMFYYIEKCFAISLDLSNNCLCFVS